MATKKRKLNLIIPPRSETEIIGSRAGRKLSGGNGFSPDAEEASPPCIQIYRWIQIQQKYKYKLEETDAAKALTIFPLALALHTNISGYENNINCLFQGGRNSRITLFSYSQKFFFA